MKKTETKIEEALEKIAKARNKGKKIAESTDPKDKEINKQKAQKDDKITTLKKSTSEESQICKDKDCPIHGKLKTRGRVFWGRVIKKFHKRIMIEFERKIYVRKYERYSKSKTKIHARLPICMDEKIDIGDLVKVQECRPLSKMIHFVVIEKVNGEKNEVNIS